MSTWYLGLTGGIGSGKSAASDYLHHLGIDIVDADIEARNVVMPNQPAWRAIKAHFGTDAINSDNSLNRAWLRETVFANPQERMWLEQLTHPLIRQQIEEKLANSTSAYSVLVSPLLFESKQSELVNRVLLIDVSEQLQLQRASLRDGVSQEQIKEIIKAQMPREQKQQLSHDIILNDTSLNALHQQLDTLHNSYLKYATSTN